jgi:hypothetical protein
MLKRFLSEIFFLASNYIIFGCGEDLILNVKAKQPRYRPGVAQRVPGS